MVRPREFDEQQALLAAMNVFWEKGFEAASISDLTSRMGIQRPSLYGTFGSKEELFKSALAKYAEMSVNFIHNQLKSVSSAREAIHLYLSGIIDYASGRKPELGCLCVNTIVELAPHNRELALFTKDYQRKISELLEQTIERGMRTGELSENLNAVDVANALVIAAIGLSVTMKSFPEHLAVKTAVAQVLRLLD